VRKGASGPTGAVPGDRRSPPGPTRCKAFSAAPGIRHARCGEPRLAAAPLGPFLRLTGLPSHSALIAPPLRLAALRWRVGALVLVRLWPPPGVSTAFLPAVAHFSGGASKVFSVSRVREPGTAERELAYLRSDGDRRMPGTRPLCPRRQASLVGDFSSSVGHVILGPREAREGAHRLRGAFRGPRDAEPVISPVAFRSPACRSSFSDDWLRHERSGSTGGSSQPKGKREAARLSGEHC
jgi:hypothetical protein